MEQHSFCKARDLLAEKPHSTGGWEGSMRKVSAVICLDD